MTRGGRRPGSGQPPKYGVPLSERIGLDLTEAERAEIEAEVPDGDPVGRWIVEAALARTRSLLCAECQRQHRVVLENNGSFAPVAVIDKLLEVTGGK